MADEHSIELVRGSTVPVPLTVRNNGVGQSVSGGTVTFSAVWLGEYLGRQFVSEQPTTYTPEATVVIDEDSCTNDPDQSANPGKVTWTPSSTTWESVFPGRYRWQLKVVFADTTIEYYPRNTDDPEYRMTIYPAIGALDD